MVSMVNADRLAATFKELVAVDSVSRSEGAFADLLQKRFTALGAEATIDRAGSKVGSDSGNLMVRLKGRSSAPALLLTAHLDTVEPGRGIVPAWNNGRFTSEGETILGADDKSAIAILIEAVTILQEQNLTHGPLELVFTICEEIGLLGIRHFDFDQLKASFGFALDATDPDGLITQAPAVNHFTISVHGREAHAGAAPEKGINAIVLACNAIAGLPIGRIDQDTTCNIGRIEGGLADNIVAPAVTVTGEVRSHDEQKLEALTAQIAAAFEQAIEDAKQLHPELDPARVDLRIERSFSRTAIAEDNPVVALARRAAANLKRTLRTKRSGGASDANIFFEHGIMVGVLGTGMREVHTTREHIDLEDMVKSTELLLEIIRLHSAESAGLVGLRS